MDAKVVFQELLVQILLMFGSGTVAQVNLKEKELILQTPKRYRVDLTY